MSEAVTVPALRFPEFEGAWKEKRTGDFLELFRERVSAATQIPVYTSSRTGLRPQKDHFDGQEITNEGEYGVVPRGYFTYRHMSDDLTFKFNINNVHDEIAVSKEYPVFTTENLDAEFLHLKLNYSVSFKKFAAMQKLGGTRTRLYFKTLEEWNTLYPSLPEQKKIAAFFGGVDAKLTALRDRVTLLERYKRGLMQALFSQSLRFTKPDGSAFPDWEEKRLGEVFSWVRTNSLSRENLNYDAGEVQNIHYGDIHTKFRATFRQSQERVPFISDGAVPKGFSDEEFCQIGDVVIADASEDYADIGKAIEIVELSDTPLVAGLHTYIARPKEGLALGFSGYLLRSAEMRRQIMRIAQGISVLGISKTNLEKLDLVIPHPDEQQKIADALSAMDAKIAAVADQVAQMDQFKKGLLQQMFV